jgi:hypothetical protein
MKVRDYFFLTLLLALVLVVSLRAPAASPAPRPTASLVAKATYWLALLRLAQEAPQSPPLIQEVPDAVVNAPAERIDGPDGHPLVAHGQGW